MADLNTFSAGPFSIGSALQSDKKAFIGPIKRIFQSISNADKRNYALAVMRAKHLL